MELKELRISEKKRALLHTMGIENAMDLLTYYPFRYESVETKPRKEWQKEDRIALEGVILNRARVIRLKGKQSVTKFKLLYEEEELDIAIFNRPWISAFTVGKTITLIAKYEGGSRMTALQYNFQPLQEQLGIFPVYNVKEGISQKDIRKYIDKAWLAQQESIKEFLPMEYLQKYRLISRSQALYFIHHPKNMEAVKQSLRHLKYEEFLKFQITMQALKVQEKEVVHGHEKRFDNEEVMDLQKTLAFSLTEDQIKTIEEILADLKSDHIMYRMVQGDVGCGKTLVAAFGMYACVLAHKQAAFLAPTEILAKQHGNNLKKIFHDYEIQVEVLYASLKTQEKKDILERLARNEIDILVGTHALFQEGVEFHDLGMVVADEQHRFGVAQRKKMLEKGDKVDFLLMSATPIPRTLAISLYGDMDVSTIQTLPSGRQKITTKLVHARSMSSILDFVLEKIDEGNQCYVVCPAIEKNEDYEMRNVTDIYQGMQASLGRRYQIGLLHGKMSAQEKDAVMKAFVEGDLQILVSTTVIEVGVDVANANIMVIYDAHRFGLSQIHQLRGRVGRGSQPGYCFLLSDSKDPDSLQRLKVCEKTNDGFVIARMI
ncbi:MAG: ATP-dependent DNA helicase RecG [Longicatena caecimuris]|uniref:ATP-dependent DNA helicase RecG n=1 Tax=Longicatena caecimuris TaxID=1796635 RepID=UPI00399A725F